MIINTNEATVRTRKPRWNNLKLHQFYNYHTSTFCTTSCKDSTFTCLISLSEAGGVIYLSITAQIALQVPVVGLRTQSLM